MVNIVSVKQTFQYVCTEDYFTMVIDSWRPFDIVSCRSLGIEEINLQTFDSISDPILELVDGEFDIEISDVFEINSLSKRSLQLALLLIRNYLLPLRQLSD